MTKDNKELCDTLAEQLIESGVDLSEMFKKDGLLKHLTKSLKWGNFFGQQFRKL